MWVEMIDFEKLGKEKSFLNKEGERVASQMVRLTWTTDGEEHQVIALMGTQACDQLSTLRQPPTAADLHFQVSPSRNNPNYFFTSCYVEGVK